MISFGSKGTINFKQILSIQSEEKHYNYMMFSWKVNYVFGRREFIVVVVVVVVHILLSILY